MKTILFVLTVISLLSFHHIPAQNLSDHLGAVKTNFQIYSDTTNLQVSEQILIKRASHDAYRYYEGGGVGYGYEEYHLEFTVGKKINSENLWPGYLERFYQDNRTICKLVFYDQFNNTLATKMVLFVDQLFNPDETEFYFYSIDLRDIPLVLLNKTVKINIVEQLTGSKREAGKSN
ncbi:MAG: hypothetical protein OEX02_11655 [Cyclobacteriaceae bacterium]|nr:hypothetical protein [Cyclobacteriaceae bacterium]